MDICKIQTEALQHAALASLACTGRTLGPDRKPQQTDAPAKEAARAGVPKPAVNKNKKSTQEEVTPLDNCILPDANTIRASMVKREVEQECKRSVRQQLKELQERQRNAINAQLANQLKAEQQTGIVNGRAAREKNEKLLHQQAEQLAKSALEAQQCEQQALIKQNNHKLYMLIVEGVSRCQSRFSSKYEAVTRLLLTLDKETVQACAEQNHELREVGQLFDQLVASIKNPNSDAAELKTIFTAEQYCQRLDKLEINLIKQLSEQEQAQLSKAKQLAEEQAREKQKQLEAEQQQKQQELEAQQKAAAEAAAAAAQPPPPAAQPAPAAQPPPPAEQQIAPPAANAATQPAPSSISSSYVHPVRLAYYNEINALYQSKVDAVKPLQSDEAWKKYRTNCQRTINVPLNAITAASGQHLTNNFNKLYTFFAGQPVKTTDGSTITINDHPLARDYCILLMAKKFVSQTDTAISSNPQAAFPFASVIVTFWKLLPDFGKIFLAYMYKESPYLVPYVIPQQQGQTPEQYLKTMGYRLSDTNELEKPDMFLKRQTGIARLYAAVIITQGRQADGPKQCIGLEEAWSWLVHIMLVKPLPDISATMIMEVLQTLGFELWRTYGKNFLKLLVFIQTYYMPQLSAYDEGGPKSRLEMLLAKFLRERQIPQAVGVLPPNFW